MNNQLTARWISTIYGSANSAEHGLTAFIELAVPQLRELIAAIHWFRDQREEGNQMVAIPDSNATFLFPAGDMNSLTLDQSIVRLFDLCDRVTDSDDMAELILAAHDDQADGLERTEFAAADMLRPLPDEGPRVHGMKTVVQRSGVYAEWYHIDEGTYDTEEISLEALVGALDDITEAEQERVRGVAGVPFQPAGYGRNQMIEDMAAEEDQNVLQGITASLADSQLIPSEPFVSTPRNEPEAEPEMVQSTVTRHFCSLCNREHAHGHMRIFIRRELQPHERVPSGRCPDCEGDCYAEEELGEMVQAGPLLPAQASDMQMRGMQATQRFYDNIQISQPRVPEGYSLIPNVMQAPIQEPMEVQVPTVRPANHIAVQTLVSQREIMQEHARVGQDVVQEEGIIGADPAAGTGFTDG